MNGASSTDYDQDDRPRDIPDLVDNIGGRGRPELVIQAPVLQRLQAALIRDDEMELAAFLACTRRQRSVAHGGHDAGVGRPAPCAEGCRMPSHCRL